MGRAVRNILLFAFVVIVITGFFFGTRGCGSFDSSNLTLPNLNNQRGMLGPILAFKDQQIIFYPGSAMWKNINELDPNWQKEAAALLEERLNNTLDTVLFMDMIPREEISRLIINSLYQEMENIDLQKLSAGESSFSLDISSIITQYHSSLRPEMTTQIDSVLLGLKSIKAPLKGNY